MFQLLQILLVAPLLPSSPPPPPYHSLPQLLHPRHRIRSASMDAAPSSPRSTTGEPGPFLLTTVALGIWSEKRIPVRKALSGALVCVLLGLAASSVGVVAANAPAYRAVLDYLLPLAILLLLFRADLRRMLCSIGVLLLAFLLGSTATAVSTVLVFLLVPMRSLGPFPTAPKIWGRSRGGWWQRRKKLLQLADRRRTSAHGAA